MITKKKLIAIKGLSEAKVDKIKEVTIKIAGVSKMKYQNIINILPVLLLCICRAFYCRQWGGGGGCNNYIIFTR